jgi:signal transduction histidine kinase
MIPMAGARRSRSTFIVVLLFATLAMTGTLAYEALEAARSHRTTAENVLRDYSTFATWELSRLGRQQLLEAMNHGIESVRAARRQGDLGLAVARESSCEAGCGGAHRPLSAFTITAPDLQFETAGAELPAGVRARLIEAVKAGLQDPENFTCPSIAVVQADGAFATVIWRPVLDRSNRPTEVIGFVADESFVSRVFEQVLRYNPLLPPSLVQAAAGPNAALSVRVATADGHALFASSSEWSAYNAMTELPVAYDKLRLAIALRPGTAESLIIGGLPRERLPLVVGLLALTTGLVVVALVQLRREAEISRLRTDFVSGVSHELRTPLAQIRMFTETLLLQRVRTEEEGRRSLEIISREAQRLSQLVENALLFSRGERRRPQITREPTNLAALVADIVDTFAPLAAARQARIDTQLDPRVSSKVDAGAMRQILLNLLDNAVKYGPAGQTVRVTLALTGTWARLLVDDEGPGVRPEDAERIWQPFSRLAAAHTATGGAGIGLAIVKQLVDLHGGRASVEPGPQGARFVVEMPDAWCASGTDTAAVA